MGGTSRSYLCHRLQKEGHFALLAAVEDGRISAYAAAVEAGLVARRPILGTGSTNESKRRMWAIAAALRDVDAQQRANGLAPSAEDPPRKNGSTPMVAGGIGLVPCMTCSAPQAMLARREIADVFLANQSGDGARRPAPDGPLPRGCCRRNLAALDPRALIG